ncbi:hypothetical protein AVEN_72518-1, partial [Araneus ventricosus]
FRRQCFSWTDVKFSYINDSRAILGADLVIQNQGQRTGTKLELQPLLQTSAPHQQDEVWSTTYDLACSGSTYRTDLQWNRVLSLKPSGPEADTLPLGYRGPSLDRCKLALLLLATFLKL